MTLRNRVLLIKLQLRRAARGWRRAPLLALALITGACMLGANAASAADLSARTAALHRLMDAAPVNAETISGSMSYDDFEAYSTAFPATSAAIPAATDTIHRALADDIRLAPESASWGIAVDNGYALPNPPPSSVTPGGGKPVFQLGYAQSLAARTELVAGHWPNAVEVLADRIVMQTVLTPAAMKLLDAHLGTQLDLGHRVTGLGDMVMQIVGVIEPDDAASAFWQSTGAVGTPQQFAQAGRPPYWEFGAFIDSSALDQGVIAAWNTTVTWILTLDTGFNADGAGAEYEALGPGLLRGSIDVDKASNDELEIPFGNSLAPLLLGFMDAQSAAESRTAMPEGALAAIALIALLLLTRSAVRTRAGHTGVLRARGASLPWLATTAAAEAGSVVLPIGAVCWAVSLLIYGRPPGGLIWMIPLLPMAVLTAVAAASWRPHMSPSRRRARTDAAFAAANARYAVLRRVVLFGTVAALCLASLQQARSHGFAPSSGIDPFTAMAPTAAAVLATLAGLALGPAAIQLILRSAATGRGVVMMLGLSRTARNPGPTAIVLLVLSLALCAADMSLALAGATATSGGGAPSVSSAADAIGAGGVLRADTHGLLLGLAALAVAAGCLVVAFVALGDAAERKVAAARLSVMGLTSAQQRAITLAELCAPIATACVCATVAAAALLWTVRPAFLDGFSATPMLTWTELVIPILAVLPLALLTGLAGAAAARRRSSTMLRLGDNAEGA